MAGTLLTASALHGQSVAVRVLEAETADPLIGAVVYLLTEDRSIAPRSLTNARGGAVFVDIPAGRYRLRAEMIGRASLESEAFSVDPGATVVREMRLEARPIDIEGIQVDVGERCRVRPEEGLAVQRVWDEARKALEATELTDAQRVYRYRTMMYERDLEPDARTVLGEERSRRVATMESPFRSRPAEELVEGGFTKSDPEGDLYFAPDAGVLLSDLFLDTHCFQLVAGETANTERLLGLAFKPIVREREKVDISGTLWLDPGTSELRWLEFRYENLDPDLRTDHVGGRVEFRRLPDGGWIVPEWWIRMPSVGIQRGLRSRTITHVVGYREAGGMVVDVEGLGSDLQGRTGAVEGVVRDSLGMSLAGVAVDVVGTGQATTTDGDGRFRVQGLVPGTYRVRFVDARLRAFGHAAAPVPVSVAAGDTTALDFHMPSAATVLTGVCAAHDPGVDPDALPIQAFGEGVLAGRVLDAATGEPLPGAEIRVITHRYEFQRGTHPSGFLPIYSNASVGALPAHETRLTIFENQYGLVTRADDLGFYRVCHVPEEELLTVVGAYDGVFSERYALKIDEDGGVIEHTVRVPTKRR